MLLQLSHRCAAWGDWREVLNSDSPLRRQQCRNVGEVRSEGSAPELNLTVPPLAAIFSYRKAKHATVGRSSHALVQAGTAGAQFSRCSPPMRKRSNICLFDSQAAANSSASNYRSVPRNVCTVSERRLARHSMAIAFTDPMSPSTATASTLTSCCSILCQTTCRTAGMERCPFGYRTGARARTSRSIGATMRAACQSRGGR